MTKEKDYLESIEEHRQEVTLEETPKRRTRTKAKKPRNYFMSLLVFVFILIPACTLAYVVFLYEPEAPQQTTKAQEQEEVQFEKNVDPSKNIVADEVDEEDEKAKAEAEAKAAEEAAAAAKVAEEQAKKDAEALAKADAEAKAKAKAEAERKAEEQQSLANAKTHVVQSEETLYRIAMNYYKNPEGVEKIKRANNLPNETISVGQTLIIPQ